MLTAGFKCAPETTHRKYRDRHRESPTRGNADPAAGVSLGFGENNIGNDAVAKQDEESRADDFGEIRMHAGMRG